MTTQDSQRLKIVFVGHVDHGKSTLIGRIFYDTNSLPDGKIESIQKACAAEGMEFEYAFLLDALLEEQEQNITIDTTQIQFKTARRPYVIIDAPGHKEFLKNMISGAASADAAFLLIAANEGVREQSRRHGYLLSMLGVSQVVVAVNKMDLVDYDQARFDEIEKEYREFLTQIGVKPMKFIPISARNGVNIQSSSEKEMPWYKGDTILQALDKFEMPKSAENLPLRFPVQDVYRFDHRRLIVGRVEAGSMKVGDELVFSPNNKISTIASIERWSSASPTEARCGDSVAVTLSEQIFIERGNVGSLEVDAPIETNRFRARIFWMGKNKLVLNGRYKLKLATQEIECQVAAIDLVLDSSTLDAITGRDYVAKNDVAELTLTTRTPVVLDNYERVPLLGRFVLVDERDVAGGGIIFGGVYTDRTKIKSTNIFWSEASVNAEARAQRNGHKGAVIWLTGLSGAGKSTISTALEKELFSRGMHCYILDGDNVRHGLNANLGFSPEDRVENIRRVAEVAKLMADAGVIVLTAFISPYRMDRRRAREIALEAGTDFIEVYVAAPLSVCETRDPKSLYKKARAGEIKQFTGIDAPYEEPEDPEITVHTESSSVNESVAQILETLLERVRIPV